MENKPKALMLASVASMIDLFNMENISILSDLGYDIDVACNFVEGSITSKDRVETFQNELKKRGIGTYHIPIPRSIARINDIISSYKSIKKLVDKEDYQIVHCHSPIGSVLCRLACIDARRRGTKVIYTAHGFHFFTGSSKKAWLVYYPIEKFCSRFTDLLITINQEDFIRAKRFKAKRVEYVPGIGVDTVQFKNTSINRDVKREEFGLKPTDFVFMSTGQVSVRKNHEVIIKALAKISSDNIKYLIVGFGEEESRLKKIAKDIGVEKKVIFAGYRSDVRELLHAVDGFAFPSLQEGLPVALMEAMSVGLPIVCSKIRGNVDLIENGKGGYVYNCFDVDGFAEGMRRIMNGEADEMGKMNIETMKSFDVVAVNSSMRKIYSSI